MINKKIIFEMKFRFIKIFTILISFFFLTGFLPVFSILGPSVTAIASGNIYKAGAQYMINKTIKDSNLPEDIRIGAIVRKNKVIIPRSNFIFEKDDLVVFLAKREQLKAVEDIFSVGSI